ncbi:MAG: hypothetical protein R2706_09845 [Acidimicrobiales bacterium]
MLGNASVPWRDRVAVAAVESDEATPAYLDKLDGPDDVSEPVWSDEVPAADASVVATAVVGTPLVEATPRNGPIEISDDALELLLGESPAPTEPNVDSETGGLDGPVEK